MKKILFLTICMALAAVLAACGSIETPTAAPAATVSPPTPTNTPLPTATPRPHPHRSVCLLRERCPKHFTSRSTTVGPTDWHVRRQRRSDLAALQMAYAPNVDVPIIGQWVYALVAPFPTVVDDVPFAAVQAAWQGQPVQCDA